MGVKKGLGQIQEYKEELQRRKEAAEAGKTNWLSMVDGEEADVWFLQEMDERAENYLEKNGVGLIATEHTKPGRENFRIKALCSMEDEGKCVGCEEHKKDWKAGWKAKSRLYINVLVKRADGTTEVAVMSQSYGPKGVIAPMIVKTALKNNTITDRWWSITRNGADESTTYTPFLNNESKDVNPADHEIFDIEERCLRSIPYAEQRAFYFGTAELSPEGSDETEAVPAGAGATDSNANW